ncbi:ABC transporter related [Catenulispora acidiphila DSM 44928]|uniref:ABC transporter related n=1 Tax=Catenulispora acidiphila (strain DSM 44928 / JCM 14897 / NBRC 102108 / NRRL B-24433 / ID139908) TaxID=479433 RepID=C7QHI8_CATAD|nr:ABC transporter ATP-binding protein [Catenulispora acidiphila]ACU69127.1 ABC transporter related [Catenulispora acidiphila DSM 44928]
MPAIEVRGLRKAYGDVTAVEDVSFEVAEGEIFGILGPNGAGKTTTVECVSGLRTPDAGEVRVLGLDPRRDREDVRQVLGVQLQESQLPGKIHVREALELYASFYRDPADVDRLLAQWELTEKAGARFGKLSGGQKQRLAVALAMVGKPRVVVLDELTTGLDPHARRTAWEMVQAVRDSGVTVLLVTHFMEEAERLCDRVAIIDAGRVVALDTPAAMAARGPAAGQRMRFRPSAPVEDADLLALPEVRSVERHGAHLEVSGTSEVIGAVTAYLARRQIIAAELRVEQSSLDDAFIALTTHATTTTHAAQTMQTAQTAQTAKES